MPPVIMDNDRLLTRTPLRTLHASDETHRTEYTYNQQYYSKCFHDVIFLDFFGSQSIVTSEKL